MMNDEKVNILVVDDLPEKLLVCETILEGLGQNVVTARSGREALRHLLDREFAVILLDVNMPDMDGFETAAMIRSRRQTAHTPIIFITAFGDEMHTAQGYSLGAVDYILSPVVPEILRTKVGVFVDLYKKTQQVKRQAEERVALAREQAARAAAEEATRRSAFLAEASNVLVRLARLRGDPPRRSRGCSSRSWATSARSPDRRGRPGAWRTELAWVDRTRPSGSPDAVSAAAPSSTRSRPDPARARDGSGRAPPRRPRPSRGTMPRRRRDRSRLGRAGPEPRSVDRRPARGARADPGRDRAGARRRPARGYGPDDLGAGRGPRRPRRDRHRQRPALPRHPGGRPPQERVPGDARPRAAQPAGPDPQRRRDPPAARPRGRRPPAGPAT